MQNKLPDNLVSLVERLSSGASCDATFEIQNSQSTLEISVESGAFKLCGIARGYLRDRINRIFDLDEYDSGDKLLAKGTLGVNDNTLAFDYRAQLWIMGRDDLGWLEEDEWSDTKPLFTLPIDTSLVARFRDLQDAGHLVFVEWAEDTVECVYTEDEAVDWSNGRDAWVIS